MLAFLLKSGKNLFFSAPILRKIPAGKQNLVLTLFVLITGTLATLVWLLWDLPLPNQISSDIKNPVSTLIFDRNGKLIYEIFAEKRRTPIRLQDLPPYVTQATIAIEDKDFYRHPGFSISGIARALYRIITGKRLEGGSTVTQQLVKNVLLTPERTLKRKIREIVLAVAIEILYSKNQILEMYLNNIPYGGAAWGIEEAARTYFGKSAKDLTLAEAAMLAGLPAAPTRFSPFGARPELAKERQKAVLQRMLEDGYITQEEKEKAENAQLSFRKPEGLKAPHFVLYVKEQLVEKYGEQMVERGGLRVTTTLDLDLQEGAQQIVKEEVDKLKKANVGNGAALVTIPKTGEILAMVGSKNYFAEDEDGKVNVVIRPRQPGSSIKPLNYALALETGKITPSTVLADVPTCFVVPGQPLYCPVNYDRLFHGAVQARFALGNSFNIPAVRVLALNGLANFVEFAKKMGITTWGDPSRYGLSLTLGGGEIKMTDMAVAFGVFANGGVRKNLVSILKVEDWKGNVLEETKFDEGPRVLSMETSYLISHILLDNNARSAAFGENSLLRVRGHPEVSVKTGTTNDKRDNWTIGYTPEVVVAVWVGNNDNSPMSAVASGITGAAPIWNKIIKEALDRIEDGQIAINGKKEKHTHVWPTKPADIIGKKVCVTTGTLPPGPEENPGCQTRFEYFLEDYPPSAYPATKRAVFVYRDFGMMAPPDAPGDQIEAKEVDIIDDPLGTPICLSCPIPNWQTIITIKPENNNP